MIDLKNRGMPSGEMHPERQWMDNWCQSWKNVSLGMTFSGRFVYHFIDFAAAQGVDRTSLLAHCSVPVEVLLREDYRVSAEVYNRVSERAVSLTGDAYFGLHLGEYLNLSAAGLISQITQTCRTIREALEYCCSFAALGCRALPMVLEERTADYRLRLIPDPLWWEASPVAVRQTVDGLVAFTLREFHTLTHQKYFPLDVHYPGPAPAGAEEYLRVFNCPVRFEQADFAIFFDKVQIELPELTSYYDLLRVLVAHAEEKVRQVESERGYHGIVRKSILHLVQPQFPSLAQVAANLNVSIRTLQRRLRAEGHTYQQILDELRREFALQYLKKPELSIKEIANLLSYADASAFIRSFRRWTQQSPRQYRSGHSG